MPDFAVRTAFTAVDKVSPAFSRMEKAAIGFRSAMSAILPVLGVAAIANYASKAIDLASSLTEVQNVVDTTFGASANQINQWSQNAINQFGLSELQAKQFTGSLGAMMKSSGLASDQIVKMSTDLSGLAGDFASFYNLPIEQAFEKIRSGISGETEPLKQLGINMSVANMQAFALTQGMNKQWGAMTQAEQTQLRYAYLMKTSADAQGDFNKTLATSYANQKRVLGVQFDQALATLAKGILPSLTEAFKSLNEGMRAVNWEAVGKVLTVILKTMPYVIGAFLTWKSILIGIMVVQKAQKAIRYVQMLSQIADMMIISGSAGSKYILMLKQTVIWQKISALATGVYSNAIKIATFTQLLFTNTFGKLITAIKLSAVWQGIVAGATKAWTAAQWLLNAALTANPIGVIIIAISALVGWIVYLVKNVDDLNKKFLEMTEILDKPVFKALLSGIFGGAMTEFMAQGRQEIKQGMEAPNKSATELQAGNTNVNIYSNGTEAKAEVTPRRGATVNMNNLGYNF